MRLHIALRVALVLSVAGCGRTPLDPASIAADVATDAGRAWPDVAVDQRRADVRTCQWTGFAARTSDAFAGNSIAAGDLDGDGAADVVVAWWGNGLREGNVSVFWNRGQGALSAPLVYDTTIEAQAVAVGDFSGDGKLDIVVTNGMRDLDLFSNQGGDGFTRTRLQGPQAVVVMATGDFNRDGHPDLGFTTQSRSIALLFGDGMGRFTPPVAYPTGPVALALAVSDVNRDGYPDLVATSSDYAGTCPPNLCLPTGLTTGEVNVLLNRGDGTFAAQATYTAGNGTSAVAAGDLDGDGAPDLVAANSVDDTLSVFFNTGDGRFGLPTTYADAGTGTTALGEPYPDMGGGVAAADFDGDGHVDIAVVRASSSYGQGELLLFRNPGHGRFGRPDTFPFKGSPRGFVVDDFNGDGLPDLALAMDDATLGMLLSTCE